MKSVSSNKNEIGLLLKKYRIFLYMSLIFQIQSDSCCMSSDEEESFCIIPSAKQLRKVIIFPFNCCLSMDRDEYDSKTLHSLRVQYQIIKNQDELFIENIPKEIMYMIIDYLNPLDIIRLYKTCKYFSFLKDDDVWKYYSFSHNYNAWNQSIPLMKIVFANFWYKEGKTRKAAQIGFPQAVKKVRLDELNKNKIEVNTMPLYYQYARWPSFF